MRKNAIAMIHGGKRRRNIDINKRIFCKEHALFTPDVLCAYRKSLFTRSSGKIGV